MSQSAGTDGGFNFELYRYTPSLAAAIASVAVFAVLTGSHLWKVVRHRTYYFAAFTIGGLFETIGYCGRIWGHYDPNSIGGFVIQAILILIAPALFAASIYMILGRLVRLLRADSLSLIPVRVMTKIFVIADVISFSLQAGGGGIQSAGTLQLFDIGEKIIVAGLFSQIASFGFFCATALTFHVRAMNHPSLVSKTSLPWRQHLLVLYAASALILVRSTYRVVEYLQGNAGYLISHEIFLYCFDMALMSLIMIVFLVWYIDDLAKVFNDQNLEDGHMSCNSGDVMLDDQ